MLSIWWEVSEWEAGAANVLNQDEGEGFQDLLFHRKKCLYLFSF